MTGSIVAETPGNVGATDDDDDDASGVSFLSQSIASRQQQQYAQKLGQFRTGGVPIPTTEESKSGSSSSSGLLHRQPGRSTVSAVTDTQNNARYGCSSGAALFDPSVRRRLCGREKEVELLQSAFASVRSTSQSRVVAVHGPSGVGKSSLIDSLRHHVVVECNGFFVSAKHENHGGSSEPYSALVAAFTEVCDFWTMLANDELRAVQEELHNELGRELSVLTKLISNLDIMLKQRTDGKDNERNGHSQPEDNYDSRHSEGSPSVVDEPDTGPESTRMASPFAAQHPSGITPYETIDAIPSSSVTSLQPQTYQQSSQQFISMSQAFIRFKQLCRAFLRIAASNARHPILLFLDDIQWADEASLDVLDAILSDIRLENVLLVLAYRDNDPLALVIAQELQLVGPTTDTPSFMAGATFPDNPESSRHFSRLQVTNVLLENLDHDGVAELLRELMYPPATAAAAAAAATGDDDDEDNFDKNNEDTGTGVDKPIGLSGLSSSIRESIRSLSEVLMQKTKGNAYFLLQLLHTLQEESLLWYNNNPDNVPGTRKSGWWEWDLGRIQSETNIADNLVELVFSRVHRLPLEVIEVLKVAAYLGYRFETEPLCAVLMAEQTRMLHQQNEETGTAQQPSSQPQRLTVGSPWLLASTTQYHHSSPQPQEPELDQQIRAWLDSILEIARKESLIEPTPQAGQYKFTHDRVQQCLFETTPEGDERNTMHLFIGLVVWKTFEVPDETSSSALFVNNTTHPDGQGNTDEQVTTSQDDDNHHHYNRSSMNDSSGGLGLDPPPVMADKFLFLSVDHLRKGSYLLADRPQDRSRLARLNLRAGKVAAQKSAFAAARAYLVEGIEQLGEDLAWTDETYEISLELYTLLAEMSNSQGSFEQSIPFAEAVLAHAKTVSDKDRAYLALVDAMSGCGLFLEAGGVAFTFIGMLGERVPRRPNLAYVGLEMARTFRVVLPKSDDDLLGLPVMRDPRKIAAMNMFGRISHISYYSYAAKNNFVLVGLRMMRLSCQHGMSEMTPFGVANFAMVCSVLGMHERAVRYGRLALKMVDILNCEKTKARTIALLNHFVLHWRQPLPIGIDEFQKAYSLGMETGDIHFAFAAALGYIAFLFYSCESISHVVIEATEVIKMLRDFNHGPANAVVQPAAQFCANLMGQADDPLILTGEHMNEEQIMKDLELYQNAILSQFLNVMRMQLALYFENTDGIRRWLPKVDIATVAYQGNFLQYTMRAMCGLCYNILYRQKKNRRYRARTRTITKVLKRWTEEGCMNAEPFYRLMDAERLSLLRNKPDEVIAAYERAIAVAVRNSSLVFEAMCRERAGVALANDRPDVAKQYMTKAVDLWRIWGADGKAEHVQMKHHHLLHRPDGQSMGSNESYPMGILPTQQNKPSFVGVGVGAGSTVGSSIGMQSSGV